MDCRHAGRDRQYGYPYRKTAEVWTKVCVAAAANSADYRDMRRLLALILVSALSASLLVAGPAASAATSSDDSVTAAAYNKKKCKKAKTKRAKKKYCKKKKPPTSPQTTTTPTTPTTTPTTPTTPTPPAGTQIVRDDAGFTNALVGSKLHKTSEGTYGYGEYTWNFCAGGSWSYRSYYYAGSTVESNDGGSYQVVEGYHAANDPNYFAGIIQVSTSNGSQYRWAVELRGGGGYMKTNTSSFEEGTFTRTVGGAVC